VQKRRFLEKISQMALCILKISAKSIWIFARFFLKSA